MFGTCDGDGATEIPRWAVGLKPSAYMSWCHRGYEESEIEAGNLSGGAVSKGVRTRATLTSLRARRRSPVRSKQDAGVANSFHLVRSILVWRCVMSRVSGQVSNENFDVLKGCLVEGDPEQQMRQRKVRRRSLVLSIALQGAILAAIVLVPLLGKPARIALANVTPVPPYYSRPVQQRTAMPQPPRPARGRRDSSSRIRFPCTSSLMSRPQIPVEIRCRSPVLESMCPARFLLSARELLLSRHLRRMSRLSTLCM